MNHIRWKKIGYRRARGGGTRGGGEREREEDYKIYIIREGGREKERGKHKTYSIRCDGTWRQFSDTSMGGFFFY